MGWYASLTLIVILGLASVAWSRYERTHPVTQAAPTTSDHWKAAFAFDICGSIQPNLPSSASRNTGFTTQGDGLIHIHPTSASETGSNATLGAFVSSYPGMELSATSVRYPGKPEYKNGQSCGSSKGEVQVKTWSSLAATAGTTVTGDPSNLLLQNGQLITIGFVPKGTSLPKPPSASSLSVASASSATSTTQPSSTATTAPTTTAPSTTAPSTTAPK